MNVIKKFTIKSLKSNKKWTIVTIIGIIISTAMLTSVFTLTSSFVTMMRNATIEETGNFHVAFFDTDAGKIDSIKDNKLVEDCMVKRAVGYAKLEKYTNPDKPYLFIEQYDDNSMKYFPIHLREGRLPHSDKEIIVSSHIESNAGVKYNVGDKVKLEVGERKLSDGSMLTQIDYYSPKEDGAENFEEFVPEKTIEYTVVGIMERPEFEGRMAPGYTVVTYLDKDSLKPEEKVDIYMLSSKINNKMSNNFTKIAEDLAIDKSHI